MGRPLNKKYFKGELQIVGRIFHNGSIEWVPLIRQHTNNLYSVLHNGVTKRLRIVTKPTEELAENEMNVMGRDPNGTILPVKWIKENTANWNNKSEQWYVINERRIAGNIEIETFYSMFVDPTVLVPGPLDIIVPEPEGFNTLSETFQLAAPDIIVGLAATIKDRTGDFNIEIKHGGEALEIIDMSIYGSVLTLLAIGRNMTVEEAELTVSVTGATMGCGGMRINEMGTIAEDVTTWKKSFAGIKKGMGNREMMGDTAGTPKLVFGANSAIRYPFIQFPTGYTTAFANRVITEGPVSYKLEDINHVFTYSSAWDIDDDGWATMPIEKGLATFSGRIDSDFFKNNNNIAVKLKIKTTLPRNISCSFIGKTGTTTNWNDDIEPFENYEGEAILFAARGTQLPEPLLYIGMQPGMSFNVNDIEFIPDSIAFSWMFASGSEETKGKEFLIPALNYDSEFCYNLAIIDGQDYSAE